MSIIELLFPVLQVTSDQKKELNKRNPNVQITIKGSEVKLSNYTYGDGVDISPICSIPRDFSILLELNEDKLSDLETDTTTRPAKLIICAPISDISDQINSKVGAQLEAFVGSNGVTGGSSTKFNTGFFGQRGPDVHWTRQATAAAQRVPPSVIRNGVPDFVVEVRSPSQTNPSQRDKCSRWILSGVQVAVCIDYLNSITYLYATVASGILPANGTINGAGGVATQLGGAFATIFEESFPWLALPALAANGAQMGPALAVNVPANTHLGAAGVAAAGLFPINHALFKLN